MAFLTVIATGIGLSMDAMAVSVSSGIRLNPLKIRTALKIALFFGFFQFAMPLMGFLLAELISSFISSIDHWIAFVLLAFIGIKMIIEAYGSHDDDSGITDIKTGTLITLAIATSIDALAAGLSLGLIGGINVYVSALIIGLITFALSFCGVVLGKRLGSLFQKRAEIIGGAVLFLLGVKILIEHSFSKL